MHSIKHEWLEAAVVGPYYIGTDDAGVEEYYDYVAERINGNIILYNFPDRTGFDLSANVILQLLKKHKNIIGFVVVKLFCNTCG